VLVAWTIILAVVLGVGWLITDALASSVDPWDNDTARWFADERTPELDRAADVGTFLGETPVGMGVAAVVAAVVSLVKRSIRPAAFFALLVAGIGGFYWVTTTLITRQRPPVRILDPKCVAKTFPAEARGGGNFGCAVDAMGAVWCWGRGDDARVGTTVSRTCPSGACVPFATRVAGVADVAQVGGGSASSCARDRGGSVSCWGDNSLGQGGAAGMTTLTTPTAVPDLPALADLAVGGAHACGVALADGAVRCWGDNAGAQLGDGTTTDRGVATPVPGLTGVSRVGTRGTGTTCALRGATLLCWGLNGGGQLGDGTTSQRLAPAPVVF